jgi:streptogramin lyase
VAGDTLYVADAAGALRDAMPLESLGVGGAVSHLAVLGDGLLVADGGSGAVHYCKPARRSCTPYTRLPMRRRGGALALSTAPEVGRLYVADTDGHQLHAHALDGRRLYRVDIEGGLKFPNEVIWLGEGRLLVVDTNHHRIVVVHDEGDGRTRLLQTMAAGNALGRGNTWPTAAARDSHGNTWVINSDGMLNNGELIVYDAAARARRRVDLGEGADPVVLAPSRGAVLVADYANYRLQRIDTANYRVETFGGRALRDALQDLQARRLHWQRMSHLNVGMMVLFGLVGALGAYLDWKARRALAAARGPSEGLRDRHDATPQGVLAAAAQLALRPDARGIVWLEASRRMLRWQQALFALSAIMLGAAWLLIQPLDALPPLLVASLGATAVLVLGLNGWLIRGIGRLRIGTDGRVLHVVDVFGRRGRDVPEAFVHTGRRLHLGRIVVPLPNRSVSMFDRRAFAAIIEPMLERTPRSNELAMLGRKLRAGDPLSWLGLVAVVAVVALKFWADR